jgi:hypothetical protein
MCNCCDKCPDCEHHPNTAIYKAQVDEIKRLLKQRLELEDEIDRLKAVNGELVVACKSALLILAPTNQKAVVRRLEQAIQRAEEGK